MDPGGRGASGQSLRAAECRDCSFPLIAIHLTGFISLVSDFVAALALLEARLATCDFVTVDTEFTGLTMGDRPRPTPETLQDRYASVRRV